MAGLAGEGEQVLMAAACAGEAGEAGGKILVTGNKIIPATVDNLPEGRRPRAPRMVNGGRGSHALICSKIRILPIEW